MWQKMLQIGSGGIEPIPKNEGDFECPNTFDSVTVNIDSSITSYTSIVTTCAIDSNNYVICVYFNGSNYQCQNINGTVNIYTSNNTITKNTNYFTFNNDRHAQFVGCNIHYSVY